MEYEYGLMTKADKYLVESIYNILQNGIKDENPRPKYEDGTPAHRANERHLVTFEALKNSEIDKNLMPKLVLNPEKNNFYDMTIDDFSMENYKPMKPQLTLPLGI